MLSMSTLLSIIFPVNDTYHKEDLRSALVKEGRSLLLKEGYAQFSLRKLAANLGVSHNAPYRHFASREELIKTIIQEDNQRFNEALIGGVQGICDPFERLYCLGEAYVLFFVDNPEILGLFEILPNQLEMQGKSMASFFAPGMAAGMAAGPGQCIEGSDGVLDRGDGFALLEDFSRAFRDRYPDLSDQEVIFGYWAKVHGMATLLVRWNNFLPRENLKERIKVMIRNAF